jgi:hypothetical protein
MNSVIITGQKRSGTTFLANFLNAQRHIMIYRDFLRSIVTVSRTLEIRSFRENLSEWEKDVLLSNLKAEFLSIGKSGRSISEKNEFKDVYTLFKKLLSNLER